MNFLRFLFTLVYVCILWSFIGGITLKLTDTSGFQTWGLILLCFIGAACHVASVTYYDLARRMY